LYSEVIDDIDERLKGRG
jgi:hypothetical protein